MSAVAKEPEKHFIIASKILERHHYLFSFINAQSN
jgi:hypothetical protein